VLTLDGWMDMTPNSKFDCVENKDKDKDVDEEDVKECKYEEEKAKDNAPDIVDNIVSPTTDNKTKSQ